MINPTDNPTPSLSWLFNHSERALSPRKVMAAKAEAERARLLREAVKRALKTRHMSRRAVGRHLMIESVVAAFNGRELPGGRRLQLAPSTLYRFMHSVRRGGRGAWGFLNLHWNHGPRTPANWGPALFDLKKDINFAVVLADRRKKPIWKQIRAAMLLLACVEIEARERTFGRITACKLASLKFRGTSIGGEVRMAFSWKTLYGHYLKWRASKPTMGAFSARSRRPALLVPPSFSRCGRESAKLN